MKPPAVYILLIFSCLSFITACQEQPAQADNTQSATDLAQAETTPVQQEQSKPEPRIMPGHIVMMCSDLDRTQKFYEPELD